MASKKGKTGKKNGGSLYKVALVKMHGTILPDGVEGDDGDKVICWDDYEPIIAQAFAWKPGKAVVLDIDCPGGSPAEAEMIGREIRYQAEMHGKPVYAFLRGMATSGGYWLACAADKIYALETSDIGSVGVITQGFGFHERNKRKGIERRVFTAGERKSQMDPFMPLNKADVKKTQQELDHLHRIFINWVVERRGDRLKGDVKKLLNGDAWIGEQALKRGLIDGIGFIKTVMNEISGKTVFFGVFAPKEEKPSLKDLFAAMMGGDDEPAGPGNVQGARARRAPYLAVDRRPRPGLG